VDGPGTFVVKQVPKLQAQGLVNRVIQIQVPKTPQKRGLSTSKTSKKITDDSENFNPQIHTLCDTKLNRETPWGRAHDSAWQ